MKTTVLRSMAALALFSSAALLTGCNSDTTTAPAGLIQHSLKAGDTFTYASASYDGNGSLLDGSDTTVVATVTGVGTTFGGKSNVVTIVRGEDTISMTQASNGTFAVYQPPISIQVATMAGQWITYDSTVKSYVPYDSTMAADFSGFPGTIHGTTTITFDGDTTVTVAGKALLSRRFTKTVFVNVAIPTYHNYTSNTAVTVHYAYAPEIGYLTSYEDISQSDEPQSPVPNGSTKLTLTGYHQ